MPKCIRDFEDQPIWSKNEGGVCLEIVNQGQGSSQYLAPQLPTTNGEQAANSSANKGTGPAQFSQVLQAYGGGDANELDQLEDVTLKDLNENKPEVMDSNESNPGENPEEVNSDIGALLAALMFQNTSKPQKSVDPSETSLLSDLSADYKSAETPVAAEAIKPSILDMNKSFFRMNESVFKGVHSPQSKKDLAQMYSQFFMENKLDSGQINDPSVGLNDNSELLALANGAIDSDLLNQNKIGIAASGYLATQENINAGNLARRFDEESMLEAADELSGESSDSIDQKSMTEASVAASKNTVNEFFINPLANSKLVDARKIGIEAQAEPLKANQGLVTIGESDKKNIKELNAEGQASRDEKSELKDFNQSMIGSGLATRDFSSIGKIDKMDIQGNLARISERVDQMAASGGGQAKIKLNPEGLGEIELRVKVVGGQVRVELLTDKPEVKELFENSLSDLRSQLAQHKMNLEDLKVVSSQGASSSDLGSSLNQNKDQAHQSLDILREMLQQGRGEQFSRQSNSFYESPKITKYNRQRGVTEVDPLEPQAIQGRRVRQAPRGDGKGERLSMVG